MASKIPIASQTAWISAVPQLLLFGFLIFIYYLLNIDQFVLFGALTYLLLSFTIRMLVLKSFSGGMKLLKKSRFEEAIPCFEKSVDFFIRNSWLDTYRYLVLFSSSKISFKEMALCNIAFCYMQIGKEQKAKKVYERILKEYPDNEIARTAQTMIN